MTEANGTPAGIGQGLRTVVMISGGGTNLQAIINRVQTHDLPINLAAVVSDRPGVLGLERAGLSLKMLAVLTGVLAVGTAIYVARNCTRVLAHEQMPPPGAWVLGKPTKTQPIR